MKTTFVCLANSFKEKGRCVAGIVLKDNKSPILNNGRPKWIRPIVSDTSHGQIPTIWVNHINLLDIVEIDVLKDAPDSYQSENAVIDIKSIKVLGKFPVSELSKLCNNSVSTIFGSHSDSVSESDINKLNYSLLLISVDGYKIHRELSPFSGREKTRIVFEFNSNTYVLSITDPVFLANPIEKKGKSFLSISLGVPFKVNNRHYKLVAGII